MKTGIEFIFSDAEQVQLIEYILKTGGKFVPDLWYKKPRYDRLSAVRDVMGIRDKLSGPIFVLWDKISQFPLEFDRIERDDGTFYFLAQGNGGPYLDYFPTILKEQQRNAYFINGDIGYYQRYWINGVESYVDVPEALKDKYRQITRFIRSMSVRVKAVGCNRWYWVGWEALKMLLSGATANVELDLSQFDGRSLTISR